MSERGRSGANNGTNKQKKSNELKDSVYDVSRHWVDQKGEFSRNKFMRYVQDDSHYAYLTELLTDINLS